MTAYPAAVCLFVRYLSLFSGQAHCSLKYGAYHDLGEWHAVQGESCFQFSQSLLSDAPSVEPPAFELVMVAAERSEAHCDDVSVGPRAPTNPPPEDAFKKAAPDHWAKSKQAVSRSNARETRVMRAGTTFSRTDGLVRACRPNGPHRSDVGMGQLPLIATDTGQR